MTGTMIKPSAVLFAFLLHMTPIIIITNQVSADETNKFKLTKWGMCFSTEGPKYTQHHWAIQNQCSSAYLRQDYKAAISEWLPLAEAGHSAAQLNMGKLYSKGHGVLKDQKIAFAWYKKSAMSGNGNAFSLWVTVIG